MKFLHACLDPLKKRSAALFAVVSSFFIAAVAMAQDAAAPAAAAAPAPPAINTGDTAWVLASAALVLLMTPGLGLFYGGMVRRKNVMATIMQSFFMICLVSVQWVIFGYTLSFSEGSNLIGDMRWSFLDGVAGTAHPLAATIPHYAFVMFQAMFAIITPALITGAFAERVTFKGFVLFSLLWATFVYDPICHWVWGGGYFGDMGALDFAGGTVVHMSSGYSALTLALLLGARKGYGKEAMVPHNLTMVLLGASLLWFGWFGFNAGSAVGAGELAASAFTTTNTATAMAAIMWCLIEALHKGKATSLGAASGAVAGLVAITPACGFVDVKASLWIGAIVAVLCYLAIQVKIKMGYDDSLDAFGIHGVGGTWGAIATGLWANPAVNSLGKGVFYGKPEQLMIQVKTVLGTAAYSVIATAVIYFIVNAVVGMKASTKDEELGLDLSQHGEEGYSH